MRSFLTYLIAITLLFGCTKKKESNDFFSQGKKIKSGFIWKKSNISPDKLIEGAKLSLIFKDNFERKELGKKWHIQKGDWQIKDGAAHSTKALNRNLVLTGVKLPENAVIEMDLWSGTEFFDTKFNLYGDGNIHDHGDGYTFIMGGWKGRISVLSKLHEHEKNRVENRSQKWQPNRKYHIKIVRKKGDIYWFIDNEIFLARRDSKPLLPSDGFAYLSFANWKSKSYFDNITIYRIEE